MATRLHIFTTACLAALIMPSIYGMEQQATNPKYQLVSTVGNIYATDMVTFVKKISAQYLVVCDRNGYCELYDLKNNYKCVKHWKFYGTSGSGVSCLRNIFIYHDKNNQALLIAYDTKNIGLHVCRLDSKPELPHLIRVKHAFKLVQAMVESKKTLVMINTDNNSALSIDITWDALDKTDNPNYEELFEIKPLGQFCQDSIIDEGLLVDHHMYLQHHEQIQFPAQIFDVQSLTEKEKNSLLQRYKDVYLMYDVDQSYEALCPIYCCHRALDGMLYLGHEGLASMWSSTNNIFTK